REVSHYRLPEAKPASPAGPPAGRAGREERQAFLKKVRVELGKNKKLLAIAADVRNLCQRFPLP
ncbi:MAG: hypothetical protein ACOY0S_03890, partial [Patescibacteria group bacterium]